MEKIMFIIEFAKKSDIDRGYVSYGDKISLYVIANDYNEAVRKASMHVENKLKKDYKILAEDGSLNGEKPDIYKPVSIKILHEEIIW